MRKSKPADAELWAEVISAVFRQRSGSLDNWGVTIRFWLLLVSVIAPILVIIVLLH